jgi:hypothetical protein
MTMKAMTVRLPIQQARELEAVAEVDEMTVSDAVRVAIDEHIQARRKDAAFRARLHESIRANQDILERLAR